MTKKYNEFEMICSTSLFKNKQTHPSFLKKIIIRLFVVVTVNKSIIVYMKWCVEGGGIGVIHLVSKQWCQTE